MSLPRVNPDPKSDKLEVARALSGRMKREDELNYPKKNNEPKRPKPGGAGMRVYFLTRSSLPSIQDGQMKIVLLCLQPPGTKKSLDQLVSECLSHNYAMTFKKTHEGDELLKFTADSILYHLDRMESLIGTEEI